MDYISPERSLDGTCGDPGPLFGDQDGILLEHMDYGEGVAQHESPPLNDGLLVDPADQIPYLAADSLPFMNDQIPCNTMKSASTSPASPSKQAQQHHVCIESDVQNDAAEQNFHHNDSETQTTSAAYAVQQKTEVVDAVLAPELHESSGNDTSNFQQETTHSDAYLGDSMLTENSSRDYQLNNSGDDDDKIPNSSALQMENKDIRKLHDTFHNEVNGTEDGQMNGMNSSPHDEQDNENFNSAIAPSDLDGMEQDDPGTRNGISTPGNQWDSPPERSAGLEKGTPSPDRRVSLSVERSPHAHSFEKLESQRHGKEDGAPSPTALSSAGDFHKLTCSRSPPARRRSQSREKHDTNCRRASSRELSPHARENSPPERKARREPRRGDGSPRRRSASPRRRDGSPRRRSASPRRRDGSPRRRSATPRRRDGSPRRRSASPKRRASPKGRASLRRRDSPPRRRDSLPRRRDSPTRKRDRSKSGSPSRKMDTSRHRREHGRSRSRSPHSRDHHRRSPRRRHSPRRRSPPSSHRQHSPRRPWSPPANRKTGLGKPGRNLFVAGFSYATTERDLEKKFARFGRVTSVRVVRDKRSGDSRGFGFLSLERDEDADAAIRACDETEWNGRIILVEKSKAPSW